MEQCLQTRQRTSPQNKALHKWFTLVAYSLNAHEKDIFTVLKDSFEIPWSRQAVQRNLWKPISEVSGGMEETYNHLSKELKNYIEVETLPTLDDLLQANSTKGLRIYFDLVAEALNDAGKDMRIVLAPKAIMLWWDSNTVKEFLWRPVQKAQLNKRSTTELSTKEIDIIFETINRHLSKHIPNIPFPNIEDILLEKSNGR